MKKIINGILIILALIIVLTVSAVVRAQKEGEEATESAKISTGQTDYALPYPGLLPDSPLYKVKMLRDRIFSLFISDPFKKAEFNLLMADKRINAGKFLADYGKNRLAAETILKGEKYFEKAVKGTALLKKEGKTANILERMDKAAKKYEEVIGEILSRLKEEEKGEFLPILTSLKEKEKEIGELKKN